jgi:quercetin dioxygenase-like cupin family protein
MWKVNESDTIPFTPYRRGVSNIKRVLDQQSVGSKRFTGFGILQIPAGGIFPQHTHPEREEIYYVLSGSGSILVDDEQIEAKDGLTLFISGETRHGIENHTDRPLTVLFVHAQV